MATSAGVYGRVYGTGSGTSTSNAPSTSGTTSSTIVRSYAFTTPSLSWVVAHNQNTQKMNVTLFDSSNNIMFAKITANSPNQFTVFLTTPMAGTVNVTFIV
jgi:hypothetical protein